MATRKGQFDNAIVVNPKRYTDPSSAQGARLFRYYTGYSSAFASVLLATLKLPRRAWILDPWNGSGVTTHTARRFGFNAIGFDLNPVMVLIAKAELLSPKEVGILVQLASSFIDLARKSAPHPTETDPLCRWFMPSTASFIRALESAVNAELVAARPYLRLSTQNNIQRASSIAAFFYVCLFGVSRALLNRFRASNPMWTKRPKGPHLRKEVSRKQLAQMFLNEVRLLSNLLAVHSFTATDKTRTASIRLGNSERLALRARSIDLVLTSPPYCTRVDYGVATAIELAVLRFDERQFDRMRRSLMGTSTVTTGVPSRPTAAWGTTCNSFLNKLYRHESKASQTYYFKNHVQYFASLFASIGEIARVLKPKGTCVAVVQDSYYKNIRNNVPQIFAEMALAHGLALRRTDTFVSTRSMVGVNRNARKYLRRRKTRERVLCFSRK